MDYSCGLGPHLGGSLKRSNNVRRSISSSKYIGGIDWHLRNQFTEQLKCLDLKLDIDCTVVAELQDFYRRRASVEQDYADALAKLANGLKQRHVNETAKRPHWAPYTTTTIWNTLLGSTLHLSEAHATLSDIFSKQMVQRLADMDEDAVRLHKQCREMMSACQDRVLANTSKLQTDQREYAHRQAATLEADRIRRRAEDKLLAANQKARSKGKDPDNSQRSMRAQNEYDLKQANFINATIATTRARNEYLIQLCATNHSVQRYFTQEAPDIVDCLVCGFHNSLARSAMMHLSCEETLKSCHGSIVEMLNRNITAIDIRQDKACFFKRNEQVYTRPGHFTFMPSKEDNEDKIRADGPLYDELQNTANQLRTSIETLRVSTDETWKTLEEVEKKLLELINQKDYDVSRLFCFEKPRSRRSLVGVTTGVSSSVSNNLVTSNPLGSSIGSIGTSSITSSASSISPGTTSVVSIHSSQQGITTTGRSTSPGLLPSSTTVISSNQSSGLQSHDTSSISHINQAVSSFSGNDPTQAGLYLSLRSLFRDARIEQEKFYLDRFSFYTQEMHVYQLMQVKLAQIQNVLASSQNIHQYESTPHISTSYQNLKSMLRHGIPVLPKFPGCKDFTKGSKSSITTNFDQLKTNFSLLSPLPPPPIPQNFHQDSPILSSFNYDVITTSISSPIFSNCTTTISSSNQSGLISKHQPRRVLRVPNVGKPKLFGGTIDEYVEATKQPIPCIILSCTRVINEFGMHQQGVFRVSGSQAEINDFKDAFENGDDPLIGIHEPRDINSTAGLLKLYFRELGEPPFPNTIFLELINITRERLEISEMIQRLRHVITQNLSRPVFVVMRYLFAFLNHVSEYSNENMMDAYNLAICFGPTLMPVPSEYNQVHYQPSVIDLIKTFIIHHLVIFDHMLPGPVYHKNNNKYKDIHKSVDSLNSHRLSLSSNNNNDNSDNNNNSNNNNNSVAEINSDNNTTKKMNDHLLRSSSSPSSSSLSKKQTFHIIPKSSIDESNLVKYQSSTHTDNIVHNKGILSNEESVKTLSIGSLIDNDTSSKQVSHMNDEAETVGDDDYVFGEDAQSISDSEDSEPAYTLAIARADFTGSSERELSFCQGDEIYLYRQLSQHWWEGQLASDCQCTRGLIPHLYIVPKAALLHLVTCNNNNNDEGDRDEMNIDISKHSGCTPSDGSLNNLDNVDDDSEENEDNEMNNKTIPDNGSLLNWNYPSESLNEQILCDINDKNIRYLSESVNTVITTDQMNQSEMLNKAKIDDDKSSTPIILDKGMKTVTRCDDENQTSVSENSGCNDMKNSSEIVGNPDKLLVHRFNQRYTVNYPISGPLGSVPENEVISPNNELIQSSPTYNFSGSSVRCTSHPPVGEGSTTRFLFNSDVDTALEEVMRGLASLEQADSCKSDSRTLERNQELTRKLCLPSAKHAPDLVMDLPVTSDNQIQKNDISTTNFIHIETGDSFAEHFAEQNLDTMRKRSEVHTTLSSQISNRFSTSCKSSNSNNNNNNNNNSSTSCGELGKVILRNKNSHISEMPINSSEFLRTNSIKEEENKDILHTSDEIIIQPKLSIADRVAVFEANKSSDSIRSSIITAPKLAPKPKRS